MRLGTWVGVGERWAKEGVSVGGGGREGLASGTAQPLMSPPQSSQKKSCGAEPEVEPEAHEGDGDKKGSAEGSSDEEGKLVIDEPAKEKKERGTLKRRAGDALEVNASMGSLALLSLCLIAQGLKYYKSSSWSLGIHLRAENRRG